VRIPKEWTTLIRKVELGGAETLLDAIWYPGYEATYQDFLASTREAINSYTAGAGELKYIPFVSPYLPAPPFFGASVWATAKSLKEQARHAIETLIEDARRADWTESQLMMATNSLFTRMMGTRRAENTKRLRILSHAALGWYKGFARPYFAIEAVTTLIVAKVFSHWIKPLIARQINKLSVEAHVFWPGQTEWVSKYMVKPLGEVRRHPLQAFHYLGQMARFFIDKIKTAVPVGVAWGMRGLAKIGLPTLPVLGGIMAFLLAILLVNYRVEAPELSDRDLDTIYGNPDLQPYRQEVASVAAAVHEIEDSITDLSLAGLELPTPEFSIAGIEKKPVLGFSERVMKKDKILADINRLHLSINDVALDPVREQLRAKVEGTLEGATLRAAEDYPEIELYYNKDEIMDILLPALQEIDPDGEKMRADAEGTLQLAAQYKQVELGRYAQDLAEKIVKEQYAFKGMDPDEIALGIATEAAKRFEELLQGESHEKSEYQNVAGQFSVARDGLDESGKTYLDPLQRAVEAVVGVL